MKKRKPHKLTEAKRKALHYRLRFERSLPSTAAREAHLRSLMGLPSPERSR
jgi:hypothetical protein